MDSWQGEVVNKIKSFVDSSTPNTRPINSERYIKIDSREAYVLLNICEQWERLIHPLLGIELPK